MSTRNIKLVIEYEGTHYHGWQYQKDLPTVQDALESAIFALSGQPIRTYAAGRTDTGVHARGQVVNFFFTKRLPTKRIQMGINAHLPKDIVVVHAEEVDPDFHARYSARERIYHYYISTTYTALNRKFCWQLFSRFDPLPLQELAEKVTGAHDFGAFCRTDAQTEHKRCIISASSWTRNGSMWCYRVAANRFLHGMVRTMVGTMIDVARGRFTMATFDRIFVSRDRTQAGPAAPAQGLVLEEVRY